MLFLWVFFWFDVVWAQPVISQHPQDVIKLSGRHADFSVVADGAQPLQYQWLFNGEDIPGARGATLHLTASQSRAGLYQVVVRDVSGTQRLSRGAQLQVKPKPRITVQPRSVIVREHEAASFEVQLNDSGPYTYINWYNYNPEEGSHAIPEGSARNVQTSRLVIPNALNAFNYNGFYWIVVSNEVGRAVSRKVKLTVVSRPQLLSGPEDRTVALGRSVAFSVSVVADNAGPKHYQWYKDGKPMPGKIGRVLRLLRVQATHEGVYSCVVTSLGGSTESSSATLSLL